MISCQRCGQPLSPNTPTCPRCGAPVSPSAGWSQPQPSSMGGSAFGGGPSSPFGAPPSPSLAYGAPQQPPRFSAGSLISDGDLPDWLRAGPDGQGARPAQPAPMPAPMPAQPPQAAWGAPAQRQGWSQPPDPYRQDIDAQHTIRQPAFGAPAAQPAPAARGQAAQPAPFAQPQPGQGQQPFGQPSPFAPQPAPFGQPAAQPGFAQPAYPQQVGQPPMPASYPQQPAYGQQPSSYPQAPTPGNYGGFPAFAPQQAPQRAPQPAPQVNAFPSIEQAGSAYNGPQVGGMAGHALLDQRALPNWLAGGAAQPGIGQVAQPQASSGMQARSLIDDQALPKWLRDQPDDAGRANASAWGGGPAAHEPMPPVLTEAYAQSQAARAPQLNGFGAPALPPQNTYAASPYQPHSAARDEAAPEWLRAQAGNASAAAQGSALAGGHAEQEPAARFAASDLIDPAALPDWVTGRAPAAPTFSSTQGWSAAPTESESAYAATGYPNGDQGYGQDFQQGYAQDGYDQQPDDGAYDGAYGGGENAQGGWDNGAWGGSDEQGASAYNLPQSPRNPLAIEELPSWLRGKGGAPDPRARAAERNPWASAAAPVESIDDWNDDEPWNDGDDQAGQQDWSAAPSGWDEGTGSTGYGRQQMSAWDDAEPSMGWGEPALPDPRDSYDRRDRRGQQDPRAAAGYAGDPYGGGYDQMADDYGEYEDDYDDDAPSARKGGRGWLGFLRRDKR